MLDTMSNNKVLRYFFPVLFLIPLNFFIMSEGKGSGIQWCFFRYQITYIGDSIIPAASSLNFVLSGVIIGKSIFYEILPVVSTILFFIAFLLAMANRTKNAGMFLAASGVISLICVFNQYGPTLHNLMGTGIPFGAVIFIVYGLILYLSEPDPLGDNLLFKHDLFFIFFCVFLIYINWATPVFFNDTIGTQLLPNLMLEKHTVFFENYPVYNDSYNYIDLKDPHRFIDVGNGHYAYRFPIVIALLITPLYAVPHLLNIPNSGMLQLVMMHISSSLIAALSVVMVYLVCQFLTDKRTAILSALIFAFATSTWSISSQTLYAHGLSGLLLISCIFLITLNEKEKTTSNIIFLGILSGIFILNRPSDAILIFPIVGYVINNNRDKFLHYIGYGIIASLPFVIYNFVIFHNILGGYSSTLSRMSIDWIIITNFAGLLVSPNKGLFVFSPVLLLAIFGVFSIRNKNPFNRFLLSSWIAIVLTIFIYASFDDWMGGESYGPRYLTCLLPYLIVFVCVFLDSLKKQPVNKIIAIAIIIMVLFSVIVQFIGVFYFRKTNLPQEQWYNNYYSYDPWDFTDTVILNSLFHKSAKPVIRNDNGHWLRKIFQEKGYTTEIV